MVAGDRWVLVPAWFNDVVEGLMAVTDGICPECLEAQIRAISEQPRLALKET
jgi:hypothetical protein